LTFVAHDLLVRVPVYWAGTVKTSYLTEVNVATKLSTLQL